MCSKRIDLVAGIVCLGFVLLTAGCTDYVRPRRPSTPRPPVVSAPLPPPVATPAPPAAGAKPPSAEEKPAPEERPSARTVASLQLTEQGRILLEQGKTDDAISVLERAVTVSPTNGQNYYYLAEAWLTKENTSQAKEFNRLAGLYLQGDPQWMVRVLEQRGRVKRREE